MKKSGTPCQVIIVGAGPAGIFTALSLAHAGVGGILVIEAGNDLGTRRCPDRKQGKGCRNCPVCHVLSGWGGAGAYSDGKLTLSSRVGGVLGEYLDRPALENLIGEVDRTFLRFGAPARLYTPAGEAVKALAGRAASAGLIFVPSPIRHMGTDGARRVLRRMRRHLETTIDIRFGEKAARILTDGSRVAGIVTAAGVRYQAPYVVLAPGRAGLTWLAGEAKRLSLSSTNNPVDIGVRVEAPVEVMRPLTDIVYEAKLLYTSRLFQDQVRTFCMCPAGEVVMETLDGLHTVNGQSYAGRSTDNTNFALLVGTSFTRPFDDPVTYGRHIAGLANLLSGGILVQRLGDLDAGRRSTPARLRRNPVRPTFAGATPGDLSFALPYRHLTDIREMIGAMEAVAPGLNAPSTLLYGVETKFYSIRLRLRGRSMETQLKNLFAVGDGAGVSRGLVQAACSGLLAAACILERI